MNSLLEGADGTFNFSDQKKEMAAKIFKPRPATTGFVTEIKQSKWNKENIYLYVPYKMPNQTKIVVRSCPTYYASDK